MTYEDTYNDEEKEKICLDYLVASVMTEKAIIDRVYADKPEQKRKPEPEKALAALLASESVFLNTNWSQKDWPEEARDTVVIYASCNDVFAWGCADAEEVDHDEINDVFDHWMKDRDWGVAVWCIKKCKLMPQPPVERLIRLGGIWNLDEMDLKESPFKKDWSAESLDKRYGKLPEPAETKPDEQKEA